jgi:hypothetical protein
MEAYSTSCTVESKTSASYDAVQNGPMVLLWLSETASGNAILYINPHTTFYLDLRYSDEGLNVQCRTWDSFFYQGLTTIVDGCTPRQTVDELYAEN